MATFKANAGPEIEALILEVRDRYHHELVKADVTIDAIMAASDGDEPAVKHHGYPAAAVIRKNNLEGRLKGLKDATITFDHAVWNGLDDKQRVALIDHELTHLEVVYDSEGAIKYDDAGRPKLSLRPHDFELGIFNSVIRRHGAASMDLRSLEIAAEKFTQASLPFDEDGPGAGDLDADAEDAA